MPTSIEGLILATNENMSKNKNLLPLYFSFFLLLAGCGGDTPVPAEAQSTASTNTVAPTPERIRSVTATLDGERIIKADSEPGNWLAHGRNYAETRFSPLSQINQENVDELGLAWYFDTGTKRGLEASPIVVDGVMFTTGSWSVVFANDARTGELLWKYDPQVPKSWGKNACCDVVNRGVAVWKGKVYVGTIDGRLVALDAGSGDVIWDISTIDRSQPYTITGAPRVVKDKVIIGNGGGEYGVRGYVTAYDAETGEQAWRFYTVPGNPDEPFESPAMEMAAKTWTGEWWKMGGGGTAWDSMAYDPELDQLYIGVGNGSPWNQTIRSPGGGDNLFLSSIVAVDPDDGAYLWHYQTTPGETWDYTATQHMILAELNIGGETRKVIMQAPKNGFFYVLDRTNGELISAEKYIPVTWATGVDPESGRPIETPNARYQGPNPLAALPYEEQVKAFKSLSDEELAQAFHLPGPFGGHNWHPMAYSPDTGLVYIPVLELPGAYMNASGFEYDPDLGRWNTGTEFDPVGAIDPEVEAKLASFSQGYISAWDPVEQEERFRVQHPGPWNGGLLATAGNLIFQGTSSGLFKAFRADSGEELWSSPAQTGVIAPPVTYTIDGQQYVSVVAGWGGGFALSQGEAAEQLKLKSRGRILTFKLGGDKQLPPTEPDQPIPVPPEMTGTAEQVAAGRTKYHHNCAVCHGMGVQGGGVIPDLRHMVPGKYAALEQIVLDGALESLGMPGFGKKLTAEDVDNLRHYIIAEAHELQAELNSD